MTNNMYGVMMRINEIRKRFGPRHNTPALEGRNPDGINSFNNEIKARLREPQEKDTSSNRAGQVHKKMSVRETKDLARELANRKGVSSDLVDAIIKTESSYKTDAVSPKGAIGLMQIMPNVARSLGVQDPYSPTQNINAGIDLLKHLLKKYNGDYKKTLAAYNAGEKAVDKNGGVPDYRETRNYIQRVMNNYLKNAR